MFGLKDLVNFAAASASGTKRLSSLHLRSLLTHLQNFYPKVESFTKNGDKFGWVKYWQMTFNSPNLQKFSPTTILCYTVYIYLKELLLLIDHLSQ